MFIQFLRTASPAKQYLDRVAVYSAVGKENNDYSQSRVRKTVEIFV